MPQPNGWHSATSHWRSVHACLPPSCLRDKTYGPVFLRARYRRWRFPANAHLVVGVLNLLAALFLSNPITRIWGVALAALITFVTIVTLLNHGKYGYSVPAMLVLAALVPATLAGPL